MQNKEQKIKDALYQGYLLLKEAEKDTSVPTGPTGPGTPTGPPVPSNKLPFDLLDLKNWTLMLPIGNDGDPDNEYPAAKKLNIKDVFYTLGDGVAFRARVDGVHSANSSYPRCELREMKDEDWGKASWTNKSGSHMLEVTQAITATPVAKPHVVSAQIHNGSDDVIQIRLEGKRLMVMYKDGKQTVTLDDNYVLGTKFDIKVWAVDSKVKVIYNGMQKADLPLSGSGWYFKVGCYTQSNETKGDKPEAYGEVVVYKLKVTHS